MKKVYVVKAINPNWLDKKAYRIYATYDNKPEAVTKKSELQRLGYIKVIVKQQYEVVEEHLINKPCKIEKVVITKLEQSVIHIPEIVSEVKTLTTETEVIELMRSSKSEQEWNKNCDAVKKACNGYPDFWYSEIVVSGLASEVQSKILLNEWS